MADLPLTQGEPLLSQPPPPGVAPHQAPGVPPPVLAWRRAPPSSLETQDFLTCLWKAFAVSPFLLTLQIWNDFNTVLNIH